MEEASEQVVVEEKGALAARYRKQAGHVLLAARFDTIAGRLLVIFSNSRPLGSMWIPMQGETTRRDEAKAACAWCNSTLGALGFLMMRGTKLTNPSLSQAELAALRVPGFKTANGSMLAEAYEQSGHMAVKLWKHAAEDDVRDCLDRAAAAPTGIDLETSRDWRARISQEPTVSNVPATDFREA